MDRNFSENLALQDPHALDADAVLRALAVNPETGLTGAEVMRRRELAGRNEIAEHKSDSALDVLLHQFKSPVVGLLAAAAALSLMFADWPEALAIFVVLVINTAIGFATELKAQRSMQALRELGSQHQRVRRDGHTVSVPAGELVPGDVVLLEEGDVATADIRLITSTGVAADELTLTGELVPIAKSIKAVSASAALGDRLSMIFKGTAITRGAASGVVTATGTRTELGRIAELAASAKPEDSPLTKKLARLSNDLILVVLALAAAIGIGRLLPGPRSGADGGDGHLARRSGNPRRTSRRGDAGARTRDAAHGREKCSYRATIGGRDAWRDDSHLDRQDGNTDRESDDSDRDLGAVRPGFSAGQRECHSVATRNGS